MPRAFGRRANFITKLTIFGGIIGLAALFGFCNQIQRAPIATGARIPIEQPVPFSHEVHVGQDGIDCRYCHNTVEVSPFAGIPPTETCMNCHRIIQYDSPNLELVRQSWETGQRIEWNRVYDLGDYVFFNHSIHVAKGVGCTTCHGQVDEMPVIYQENALRMEWCLNCHRNPEKYLRPKEFITSVDYRPPDNQEELGRQLVAEYHVQSKTSCSICHR